MSPRKPLGDGRSAGCFPVQHDCRRIILRNDSVAPERGLSNKLHHADRA